MMRGFTIFKCPKCGELFRAPDFEDNATVFTMPMPCPCCGTKSPKASAWDRIIFHLSNIL